MFARVSTLFLALFLCLACAASASAHPASAASAASAAAAKPSATAKPSQSAAACNTGSIQCCNALQSAGAPGISVILGLLGIKVGDVNAIVGFGCAPITVGGAGAGASCAAQPVCCTSNSFNGLINIGCTPINI